MDLMYWITRLDSINTTFLVVMVFAIIGSLAFVVARICGLAAEYESDQECAKKVAKGFRPFVIILPIVVAGVIFIPSTNDALIIYGVGGTLEWVQDNDKIKQIPDKAVEALSLYLDNINDEQREKGEERDKTGEIEETPRDEE